MAKCASSSLGWPDFSDLLLAPVLQVCNRVRRDTDNGYTLVEVLIATAVASMVLATVAALLVASARVVSESDAETTATWLAASHLEAWRASATPAVEARSREHGRFDLHLRANQDATDAALWHVRVSVTGIGLRVPVLLQTLTTREAP